MLIQSFVSLFSFWDFSNFIQLCVITTTSVRTLPSPKKIRSWLYVVSPRLPPGEKGQELLGAQVFLGAALWDRF